MLLYGVVTYSTPSIISGVASKKPGTVLYSSSGVSQCFHCHATAVASTLLGVDVRERRVLHAALVAAVVQPFHLATRARALSRRKCHCRPDQQRGDGPRPSLHRVSSVSIPRAATDGVCSAGPLPAATILGRAAIMGDGPRQTGAGRQSPIAACRYVEQSVESAAQHGIRQRRLAESCAPVVETRGHRRGRVRLWASRRPLHASPGHKPSLASRHSSRPGGVAAVPRAHSARAVSGQALSTRRGRVAAQYDRSNCRRAGVPVRAFLRPAHAARRVRLARLLSRGKSAVLPAGHPAAAFARLPHRPSGLLGDGGLRVHDEILHPAARA